MPAENKSFIKVDPLLPQVSLERACAFYGVSLPELHKVGAETRTRCFLACGKAAETGGRALAIQEGHPAKQWHCHQYGCGKDGNLVSLCDLLKPGPNMGGRPRGERFREIAADLKTMVEGTASAAAAVVATPAPAETPAAAGGAPADAGNVPLARSVNERVRFLADLDRKFVTDVAAMTPAASLYFRRRPFLTPEVCRVWRTGFLPRDAGEDKSGGTMRGRIVYPLLSEDGEVLTWFGRDPEFEEKHRLWQAAGKPDREPEKFHFVKGFRRGLELFGQHRLRGEKIPEKLAGLGLVIVEGPNDVIRLDTLGVPSVGLCSNTISDEQAAKAARLVRELGCGHVTLLLDCDEAGEAGMRQAVWALAVLVPVTLGWNSEMFGGDFKGRQPESLKIEEWERLVGAFGGATK